MKLKRHCDGTYSDGGRQQPASIGVNFADLYCLRVWKTNETITIYFVEIDEWWEPEVENAPYIFLIDYCSLVFSQDNSSSASSFQCC